MAFSCLIDKACFATTLSCQLFQSVRAFDSSEFSSIVFGKRPDDVVHRSLGDESWMLIRRQAFIILPRHCRPHPFIVAGAHELYTTTKRPFYQYEVRELFPWEILTKTVTSFFLNVEKIWNSAQINLSSTLNFYRRYCFRRNNIHREIDQWNQRRFCAKWHVTVPNSVTPIKFIVCKWIYISQGWYCQITHKLHVY